MRRLALLAALTFACGAGLGERPCSADRDCPSPQTCVAGRCASAGFCIGSPACNSDAACGAGQHCANGCCQPGESGTCARDADCSSHPSTPVCDTSRGACVACLTARDCGRGFVCDSQTCVALTGCSKDADCPRATPRCDTQLSSCVECLTSRDCLDPTKPSCSADHTCIAVQACTGDAQCAKPLPRCLVSAGHCVACLTSDDCVAPLQCDPSQNVCLSPSATNCTTEADCASNAVDPHCLPGQNGRPGVCVQCLNDGQCQAGQVCDASNSCVAKTCGSDGDCAAPTPRCDLADSPHLCVQCLGDPDCSGGTCQPDHTCAAPAGCTSDKDCAQNVTNPHCNTGTGACVQCLQPADCGAGKTCSQNVCVTAACRSDNDCSSLPATPHCDTGSGQCVECTSGAQCAQGDKCVNDACAPVCTTATQGSDCPPATPVCRVAPFPLCVQCLGNDDCGATEVCDSTNTCVPQPGCTSGANCPSSAPVCLGGNCVQCASSSDCHNGEGCDTSAHTCTLTGGLGEICGAGDSCSTGLICVDMGGPFGPVCLATCNPYAPSCGAGTVCRWYGFDSNDAFAGVCAPPDGHATVGQACDPNAGDSCEWNLICAPTSDSTGVCRSMCDPARSGNCGADTCNGVAGAMSGSTLLSFGYCGPASTWGSPCVTDTPPPAGSVGNCGSAVPSTSISDIYCTPSTLIADSPPLAVLGLCTFTPSAATAVGGAGDSCAANTDLDCRTGLCLTDGPVTCFAGCSATADCNRDCLATSGAGCPSVYCVDVDYYTGRDNIIGTCEPTCRDDADCAALAGAQGRACVPSPIHGNFSWRSFCSPVQGSGAPGSPCTGGSDCGSGACVTAATLQQWELQQAVPGFTATDGFCLGAALAGDCNTAGTVVSINAALPLQPGDNVQGVMGRPNPGVCWPQACTRDANCAGLSADPSTPRICAPYKTTSSASTESTTCSATKPCASGAVCNDASNNPNPGNAYGSTGGIFGPNGYCRQESWALECAPSLGASLGGPGAACTFSTECRTGHCLVQSGVSNYCFGGCASNAECAGGTTCKAGAYLGMSVSFCQP
ncbi:MAG TPA: hypothetical protein VLW85_10165 [Myxococcales bacterium]|nr:hypothetical protein [Myxococcales bacterium]